MSSEGRTSQDVRYGYSKMTDTWYRVTDWEPFVNGKMIAKEKEEVDEEDVPARVAARREGAGAIVWPLQNETDDNGGAEQ